MNKKPVNPIPIIGLETEYALVIDGDPTINSTRACQMLYDYWKSTTYPFWDYDPETPSQDARGWIGLRVPSDNAATVPQSALNNSRLAGREKPSSQIIMVDRTNLNAMLPNGARFYIDHAHPEYSTPECSSLSDLLAADVAGQMFMMDTANYASKFLPANQRFSIYKNNTGFHGESWGCHENYLMDLEFYAALFGNFQHRLFTFLVPFLVTRQIFCGAGRPGGEGNEVVGYQISQRADFIQTLVGVQTVFDRPIINTRDEPLSDKSKYRRLHVIIGDANMAEYSNYLKVGTTRLILEMLQTGLLPFDLTLSDPVKAIKSVSRDLTCRKRVLHVERRAKPYSALEIQFKYLEAARRYLDTHISSPENEAVWSTWSDTLTRLSEDPELLGNRLDWIIKMNMLRGQISKMESDWNDARVKGLDIKYHDVTEERSIYYRLLERGRIDRLLSDDQVKNSLSSPPSDTRAHFRSKLIQVFGSSVFSVNWDRIKVWDTDHQYLLSIQMLDPTKSGADIIDEIARQPFSMEKLLNRTDIKVSKEVYYAKEETSSGSTRPPRETIESQHI